MSTSKFSSADGSVVAADRYRACILYQALSIVSHQLFEAGVACNLTVHEVKMLSVLLLTEHCAF